MREGAATPSYDDVRPRPGAGAARAVQRAARASWRPLAVLMLVLVLALGSALAPAGARAQAAAASAATASSPNGPPTGPAASAAPAPAASVAAAPSVALGRRAYTSYCTRCHGINLVVGSSAFFDLRTFPREDKARFLRAVRQGLRAMPAWEGIVKPEEMESIWLYVGSVNGWPAE